MATATRASTRRCRCRSPTAATSDVRAHVAATLPAGWRSVPSAASPIPAGGTATVKVPVVVPLDLVGGPVRSTRDGRSGPGSPWPRPTRRRRSTWPRRRRPTCVDHVDFGNSASENGARHPGGAQQRHQLGGGPDPSLRQLGQLPGSWYSATVDVPAGQPFILRSIETYDGARTKKYNVYVDDVLVKTQLVPRTESGEGTKVYDALVADPACRPTTATSGSSSSTRWTRCGFFDPSIADTWVLAVPADTQAPDVSAVGHRRHRRRQRLVPLRRRRSRCPRSTTAPVRRSSRPARPPAGRRTSDRSRSPARAGTRSPSGPATPPATLGCPHPRGVDRRHRTGDRPRGHPGRRCRGRRPATLAFTATDALSGVGRHGVPDRRRRLEDGRRPPVTVTGYGDHTVDYASTDVAGNPETMRHAVVSLADVDTVAALLAPQVTGHAEDRLDADVDDGHLEHQGPDVHPPVAARRGRDPGATGATYKVGAADVGKRLSVRVTATKAGKAPGRRSRRRPHRSPRPPRPSGPRSARPRSRPASRSRCRPRSRRPGSPPPEQVAIVVDGKVVRTLTLSAGKASASVTIKKKGKHTVVVRYLGSAVVAASASAPRIVNGR